MSSPTLKSTTGRLATYFDQVVSAEDCVLLREADSSLSGGANRMAYVAVWLACAESIKRKFKELSSSDAQAGKISGEVVRKEGLQQSVDKYLLDQAKDYGLIGDSEHATLAHIYAMRCVYGHPYEQSPSPEVVVAAASEVVRLVLSRPTLLRHAYLNRQLEAVFTDRNFLDDDQGEVDEFAELVHRRSDPSLHLWFSRKLIEQLAPMRNNILQLALQRRATWFTQGFIRRALPQVSNSWNLVEELSKHREAVVDVMVHPEIFRELEDHPRGIIVRTIAGDKSRARALRRLSRLSDASLLAGDLAARYTTLMESADASALQAAGFAADVVVPKIVDGLKSRNWYSQNPAVNALRDAGPAAVATLPPAVQVDLGRNLLQAAEGDAVQAKAFVASLTEPEPVWPPSVIEGVVSECFVNEDGQVRFKREALDAAVRALVNVPPLERGPIVSRIADAIASGTPKPHFTRASDRDEVLRDMADAPDYIEPVRVALAGVALR